MRIDGAEVRCLRMPLRAGFETSFGRVAAREMVIVVLRSAGLEGFGEAPVAARPHYSAETQATARHVLRDFVLPAVLGRDVRSAAELLGHFTWVRGHNMARAAVEAAWRDLAARAAGVSLASTLGASAGEVEVGVSLGIPEGGDVESLLDEIARRVAEGYGRVKLKIRPGFDRAPLERARARFPDLPLAADANGAYRLEDEAALRALDDLGLIFIEQPLPPPDLAGHARLARALRTPVCLDESLASPEELETAIALGLAPVVNLKPARVGGLTAALRVRDLASRSGLPLWCGGMLETGIGRAANLALAATPGFTLPGDLSASDRYYEEDLVEPPFRLLPGGRLAVPRGPGIGVEVVRERLERVTVALEVLRLGSDLPRG